MSGKLSLTFDDGPDPVWTPRVLDVLEEVGVRATFFVVATLAERHPSLLRRASGAGHEIALHCTRHLRHDRMTASEIYADAEKGLRVLGKLGHDAGDWRTPWGVVTGGTKKAAEDLGLRLVGWTADSEDWRGEPSKVMLSRLAPGIGPGGVVLMHDGVGPGSLRDGCGETVELLAPLVSLCRSRDLEPVPLGELSGVLPDRNPGPVAGV
ncbi:polysaccharide deacetylase family protein [Rubrobacter tropicus]|uniref:Polysaccharide deacetylase family protein n=1 Tax=Rubrobacter tropicus TaxID=2653851 RepID=A0A6G8Q8Z3_9ACTN|nr:polysaccharide deacetylase family protein [Rubrobacter tropicus]QIN82913.1 polysaccharide deacetylase family protein [Rubrobacter tropicus]